MTISESAATFATALIHLYPSEHELLLLQQELAVGSDLLHNTKAFKELLSSPNVEPNEKKQILKKYFSVEAVNVLLLLHKKEKLHLLGEISEALQLEINKKQGIVKAELHVARPSDQRVPLQQWLEKMSGKKVIIDEKIDPKLLGGFALLFDHKMIDASLLSRLNKIKNTL